MKEQNILQQDVIGTDPPKEEGKIKKYIRLVLASLGIALFLAVFIMAALRRCGG